MFASLLTVALAASSVAAAPLQARKAAPDHWSNSYLEDYLTYHTRYIALGCQNKHDDQGFFDACCRPLSAGQNLQDNRPDWCIPSDEATKSAVARIAANAAKTGGTVPAASATPAAQQDQPSDNSGAEYFDAGASSSTSTEAPKPSPTEEKKQDNNNNNQNQGGNVLRAFSNGKATHFTPWDGTGKSFSEEPQLGNCGMQWSDFGGISGKWVALKTSLYNGGQYCGKTVKLTAKNGATSYGTILDSCPSCSDEGHIDVSPAIFNDLQNIVKINFDNDDQPANDPGELEVSWEILG